MITHPLIARRTAEPLQQVADEGAEVVVHDVALLVENGLADSHDDVVVVAADPARQLDRLVRLRGMSEQEARALIAAQTSVDDRFAVATHVIRNDGSIEDLRAQVSSVWDAITAAARGR